MLLVILFRMQMKFSCCLKASATTTSLSTLRCFDHPLHHMQKLFHNFRAMSYNKRSFTAASTTSIAFVSQRNLSGNRGGGNRGRGSSASFSSRGRAFSQSHQGSRTTSSQRARSNSQRCLKAPLPTCPICKKKGHDALHRFDNSY